MMRATGVGVLILAAVLGGTGSFAQDQREAIALPDDARAILKAQMLGHVVSLDRIIAALGESDFEAAAATAEAGMGVVRLDEAGKQGRGVGVAEHVPEGFRAIAKVFHEAADAFGATARAMPAEPDASAHAALMRSLRGITAQCRDCHDKYRIAN